MHGQLSFARLVVGWLLVTPQPLDAPLPFNAPSVGRKVPTSSALWPDVLDNHTTVDYASDLFGRRCIAMMILF
jgi:hypothetical protein